MKQLSAASFSSALLLSAPAYADCTSPAGEETNIIYNGDCHTYQFCNGTQWIAFGAVGGGFQFQPNAPPTAPSGSGYFVLSGGTYNGKIGSGSRIGADAACLTDLTTNTGLAGYAAANANGQLVASKVHAFICDVANCNNLMPLTTYYFANAGNSSAGCQFHHGRNRTQRARRQRCMVGGQPLLRHVPVLDKRGHDIQHRMERHP